MPMIHYTPIANHVQLIDAQLEYVLATCPADESEKKDVFKLVAQAAKQMMADLSGTNTEMRDWYDHARHTQVALTTGDHALRLAWSKATQDVLWEVVSLVTSMHELPDTLLDTVPASAVELAAQYDAPFRATQDYVRQARKAHTETMASAQFFYPPAMPFDDWYASASEALFAQIREAYQSAYAPPGSSRPIEIDTSDIWPALLKGQGALVPPCCRPDATRMLKLLHCVFGETAPNLKYVQAAERFISVFRLRSGREPEVKSGNVVLGLSVATDEFARKWHKMAQYEYRSKDRLATAITVTCEVIEMVRQNPDHAAAQASASAFIGALERDNWSPTYLRRFNLHGCDVRLFQSTVRFHIPEAVAADINAFLTQWAPHAMRAA